MTAKAQPKTLISQLSGPNGTDCRPEPGRPTTLTAQVPRPSSSSTNVPKNSASIVPAKPARSLVIDVICGLVCPSSRAVLLVVEVNSTRFPNSISGVGGSG